jgi:hypothetical protein
VTDFRIETGKLGHLCAELLVTKSIGGKNEKATI